MNLKLGKGPYSGSCKALISASKQTSCTLAVCDFEWVTVALHNAAFLLSKWWTYSAGLVVTWLVPHETATASAHVLCSPYDHAPVSSVTLFEATYAGAYTFSCNLPSGPAISDRLLDFMICANAVDPEVISETWETVAVSRYLLQIKKLWTH